MSSNPLEQVKGILAALTSSRNAPGGGWALGVPLHSWQHLSIALVKRFRDLVALKEPHCPSHKHFLGTGRQMVSHFFKFPAVDEAKIFSRPACESVKHKAQNDVAVALLVPFSLFKYLTTISDLINLCQNSS